MTEDEVLGSGTIAYIASTIADGTATPEEARRLLKEFVRQAKAADIEPRLIEHVCDCFTVFLAGNRRLLPSEVGALPADAAPVKVETLDHAFGLTRGRGQPQLDDNERTFVALCVLVAWLGGKSREDAIGDVAEDRRSAGRPIHGDTQVRDCWRDHRVTALSWLRLSRAARGLGWTDYELKRLRKIYKAVPDIKFPAEKSANTPP